ncbi:MAG: response regulator transcription factor [Chloroflexota bacterium]|nr:response regulator transcription factor [Chloroflexota bacterium]
MSIPDTDLRLIVVAENLLARAGLAALLEARGFAVVAQSDGGDLDRAVAEGGADALVVDLGWQSENLRQTLADWLGDMPVLALVSGDETEESLLALMGLLGTCPGYAILPREGDPEAFASALYAIDFGLIALDPGLPLLPVARIDPQLMAETIPLTPRENEVLQLLAQGMTNKAIALDLGITEHTVKFHVNAIMGKLGAQSRTEAVVRATQLGLIVL